MVGAKQRPDGCPRCRRRERFSFASLLGLAFLAQNLIASLTTPPRDLYLGVDGTLVLGSVFAAALATIAGFGAFAPYLWFELRQADARKISGWARVVLPAVVHLLLSATGLATKPIDGLPGDTLLVPAAYLASLSALCVFGPLFCIVRCRRSR